MSAMDCSGANQQLSPFIDGELSLSSTRLLMQHLDGCASCRATLAEMRASSGLLHELRCAAPSDLGANIREAARSTTTPNRFQRRLIASAWPRVAAMLVGAACVALVVSLSDVPTDTTVQQSAATHGAHDADFGLGLDGSFAVDFRAFAGMPEGRLIAEMTGGR